MAADRRPQVLFFWLLLAVVAGLAFSQSVYFQVREVEVTGLRSLTRPEVLAVAGIRLPANVFALNPKAIAQRLAAYPPVERAAVKRRLPARLTITVVERRAVGALPYGRHYLVFDAHGVPFAVRPAPAVRSLPKVSGYRVFPVRLGVPARHTDLQWLAALLEGVPAPLRARLERVNIAQGALTLELRGGLVAHLGSREEVGRKLGLVESILAEAEAQGWRVEEIDVRDPERPFLRRETGGEAAGRKHEVER